MVYLNPGGRNFGPANYDGYGISNIIVGITYTLALFGACIFLWFHRHHPAVKMRKVPLMILAVFVIHIFCFIVFTVYTLNGAWPCSVEFWAMNLYFPMGIGLFQAQNQQLLIISRQQTQLITQDMTYRAYIPRGRKGGFGRYKYWIARLKFWWRNISAQGKYEGLVFIGMIVQFSVSMIIYNISRKFNHYGVVDHHTGPALCRRGWEWVPSIGWQFLWNWFFGPYLLWKIHMIRDIYLWRLQTILAVVSGLPGTPLWLAAVYSAKFAAVNKYWIPPMWFVPGLMVMEIVTVAFPVYQILKHKRAVRETARALDEFDQKKLNSSNDSSTLNNSSHSGSVMSKRSGRMYSMESLDECLAGNHDGLQMYASCMELNGENILFLSKVLAFRQACQQAFHQSCKSSSEFRKARCAMFRSALGVFITLVHSRTASYPINIESTIYNQMDAIFGPATALVASVETFGRSTSFSTSSDLDVTPWDEAPHENDADLGAPAPHSGKEDTSGFSFPMKSLSPHDSNGTRGSSTEHMVDSQALADREGGKVGADRRSNPFEGVKVPADFDEKVFDAAFTSVRYMVWSETWQRYCAWKRRSGNESVGMAI